MKSSSIMKMTSCAIVLGYCIFGCQSKEPTAALPQGPGKLNEVSLKSDTLQLLWDPPASTPTGTTAESYEVFFRVHASLDSGWSPLASGADAISQPPLLVLRSETGTGKFDFAVRAVFSDGEKSDFQSSLDPTTYNPGGWFLSW